MIIEEEKEKTYLVMVINEDKFEFLIIFDKPNDFIERCLDNTQRTIELKNTKVFSVDENLGIKKIVHLAEKPFVISKNHLEMNIGVTVSSIEDANLPLLHKLSNETLFNELNRA